MPPESKPKTHRNGVRLRTAVAAVSHHEKFVGTGSFPPHLHSTSHGLANRQAGRHFWPGHSCPAHPRGIAPVWRRRARFGGVFDCGGAPAGWRVADCPGRRICLPRRGLAQSHCARTGRARACRRRLNGAMGWPRQRRYVCLFFVFFVSPARGWFRSLGNVGDVCWHLQVA